MLLLCVWLVSSIQAPAAVLFVSPAGNDAHDGLGPEPGRALRTLQAAVERLGPGDTLFVRGGVYRETVLFPRSGTAEAPISIQPYRNEKVTVSGCDRVEGWTRGEGRIWKAPMPWTLGKGRDQVFADNEVLIEARFPNLASPGLGMYVSGLSPLWPTFGDFSIQNPEKAPGRIASKLLTNQPAGYWEGALYYGVHYQGWCAQTGVIEKSEPGLITVGNRTRTWWFPGRYGARYKPEEGRGMIVGHLHALDEPGEWVWKDRMLYLIPKAKGKPDKVEAKRRQLALELNGRQYIRIRGLSVRAASVRMDGAAWCTFDGCDFRYISHFIRQYSMGQVEQGRDTIKSGETGIYISGHDNSFLNCSIRFSAGAGFYLRGYHHTIHNCLIDEVDYTSHYLNAITDAVGDFNDYENFLVGGHVITFNTMRNAGRHFFNFYGNGTSTQSRDRGPMDYLATLFAHNHLYNGMLQTKDAGFLTGYYSSGGTLNGLRSQVIYNVMHDSYDTFAMRIHKLGIIYLDAGTCNVELHHNLLWAAPGSLQGGMWFNTSCVDIREHDNTFHPNFARTSGELKPEDFPEGRPFRFGHDFEHPPPVPDWPPLERQHLETENCFGHSPTLALSAAGINGMKDGDWISFRNVDFSRGWQSAVLRFGSGTKGMNRDRSARARPRHRKGTDPLVLEAIINDGTSSGIRKQWSFLYHTADGSWVRFNQVPLGRGYWRFRAVYGQTSTSPHWLEVHLDREDGLLISRVELKKTDRDRGGQTQIYGEATGAVSAEATGTRDVFLVFRSADGMQVGEFEYFRFEQCRGTVPLQKGEVKIELRLDAKDGPKLGELHPRNTGGAYTFREFVARLEPAEGLHNLFLVVRSDLKEPFGAVDWVRLEKARPGPEIAGIGVPPLKDAQGRMVLPEPTSLPCTRPADKYPKRSGPAPRLRPIFAAALLPAPPNLDGLTGDWAGVRDMPLAESWDGRLSPGLPSRSWIGYDKDAVYIAASHPVKDSHKLKIEGHEWGTTDAMEVAFQDGFAEKTGPVLNLRGWPDGHFTSTSDAGAPEGVRRRLERAVTYRAHIGKDRWSCEWRIPFAACGFTARAAPLLFFNLGVRKTSERTWAIWRGTGSATHLVRRAGRLVFPAEFQSGFKLSRSKLEVWLDAGDSSTMERGPSGKVARWKDKSGKGRDAVQPTPAFRPTYLSDGLNGRPALQFNERARTRLELPDLSAERISATIFVVFSNPEKGAEVNHHPRLFTASDGKGYDYKVGLCANIPGMATGGPRQMVVEEHDRWAKKVRVGCFSPLYQTYLQGAIAEILVYARPVPAEEQEQIRAMLALKWGL